MVGEGIDGTEGDEHVEGEDPQKRLDRMIEAPEEIVDEVVMIFTFQPSCHPDDERTVQDAEQ